VGFNDFQKIGQLLRRVRAKIQDDTDVLWTHFNDTKSFIEDLESDIKAIENCDRKTLEKIKVNFLPTSTYQEISLSNIQISKLKNEIKSNECKKFLCICVNHNKLKNMLHNVPNKDFLINACSYHCAYNCNKKEKININESIKIKSTEANSDPTDPIIEEPTFSKLKLFEYQKRTVKWIVNTEINQKKLNYSFNDEVYFGDIVYDTIKKDFIYVEDRKKITFKGGLLGDEMGLGKTFEMITLSLLNQSKNISFYKNDEEFLCSRATLILSPNHLSNQWIREFKKTINDEYNLL
jgi:SNF2 family DNA or RNA helicase